MDVKHYIESGTIESCVLGIASEAEQQELLRLCTEFEAIRLAKLQFEQALETNMQDVVLQPPPFIKELVLSELDAQQHMIGSRSHDLSLPPVVMMKQRSSWKWLALASMLLLFIMCFIYFDLRTKYDTVMDQHLATVTNQQTDDHILPISQLKSTVTQPTVKWSYMVPPADSNQCMAHVYWDTVSKKTFLLLGNIPPSFSGKHFQLWSVSDGTPAALGTFDITSEGKLLQMADIGEPGRFYITFAPIKDPANVDPATIYAVSERSIF